MPTAVYNAATGNPLAVVVTHHRESYPLRIVTEIGDFRQEGQTIARAYNADGSLYMNLDGDGYPVKDGAAVTSGSGGPGGALVSSPPSGPYKQSTVVLGNHYLGYVILSTLGESTFAAFVPTEADDPTSPHVSITARPATRDAAVAALVAHAAPTGAPAAPPKPPAPIALGWSALCALYDYRRPDDARQARYNAGISAVAVLAAEFADTYRPPIATNPGAVGCKCAAFGLAIKRFNAAMTPLLPATPHPTITALALGVNRVRMAANRAFGATAGCGSRDAWGRATGAALRELDLAVALAITMTDVSPPQE